ncbi:hypothetical protein BDA96_08G106100 [Sorghum bicolor]|nr:hypothetical protein BDA96_08G106100 [Sorghum bicolor]
MGPMAGLHALAHLSLRMAAALSPLAVTGLSPSSLPYSLYSSPLATYLCIASATTSLMTGSAASSRGVHRLKLQGSDTQGLHFPVHSKAKLTQSAGVWPEGLPSNLNGGKSDC